MKNDSMMFDPDGRDGDVTRGLRGIYAAPGDGAYWNGLESRIMRYILAADGGPWWTAFGGWTRAGAVAAAIALVAVGLGSQDAHEAERRAAYEAVVDGSAPATTLDRVTRTPGLTETEAMFRYVIAY
jgi:hypothetical protein